MGKLTLKTLGAKIRQRRGDQGLRDTAAEIEISAATLSRLENGHVPDLETFRRVCEWMQIDPGEVLGMKPAKPAKQTPTVHFRRDKTVDPQAAQDLAQMILAAQQAFEDGATTGQ